MKIRVEGYDVIYDQLPVVVECRSADYILEQLDLLEQLGLLRQSEELSYTWRDSSGALVCYQRDNSLLMIRRTYLEVV